MSEEFINYKVNLILRDGSQHEGVITQVDEHVISLMNEQTRQLTQYSSSQISDLKVLQLPANASKKNKNAKKNYNKKASRDTSSLPIDDAILLVKPSSSNVSINENDVINERKINSGTPSRWTSDHDMEIQKIKNSSEFDFAANLAMFDKKSVFAEISKNDTISPHERLVGHNKIENITKEKYDNDEMVIENSGNDNWDHIGSKRKTEIGSKNGKPMQNKNHSEDIPEKKSFKLLNCENNDIVVSCSPVQLLDIERISNETYGISPNLMLEVGAANLSQLIMQKILGGASRLSNRKNHNLPPLVLLLIGSARCGAQAFALGRHLTNHGIRVLGFVINGDDSDELLSHQWQLFENTGGKVLTSHFDNCLKTIEELDTPVEIIIDALQGYSDHLEDIFYENSDVQCLHKIIDWCNRPLQQLKMMSLDIPSGIDGGSGMISEFGAHISCRWCVSMGLPISGILHSYKNGTMQADGEITHYLIDTGIPNKVFSKANLRKFDKFWFAASSGIKLQLILN